MYVHENLVYGCVMWNECSNVAVDLRGPRGRVRASSRHCVLELHAYKRREVVMWQGLYMQLDSTVFKQVREWAAQG